MVSTTVEPARAVPMHPAHAFLLAATVPPFVGAAISDYAYRTSQQVQWINFASWLIVGGLVFCGAALGCLVFGLFRVDRRSRHFAVSSVLLLATFVLGVFNAFVHARDAWASMPTGLVLSVIVAILACVVTWIGFSTLRVEAAP